MCQGLPRTLKAMMTQYTCVGSPRLANCSSQLHTMRSWCGKSPALNSCQERRQKSQAVDCCMLNQDGWDRLQNYTVLNVGDLKRFKEA